MVFVALSPLIMAFPKCVDACVNKIFVTKPAATNQKKLQEIKIIIRLG